MRIRPEAVAVAAAVVIAIGYLADVWHWFPR